MSSWHHNKQLVDSLLERIYREFHPKLLNVARACFQNTGRPEADDIVQDVYLKLHMRILKGTHFLAKIPYEDAFEAFSRTYFKALKYSFLDLSHAQPNTVPATEFTEATQDSPVTSDYELAAELDALAEHHCELDQTIAKRLLSIVQDEPDLKNDFALVLGDARLAKFKQLTDKLMKKNRTPGAMQIMSSRAKAALLALRRQGGNLMITAFLLLPAIADTTVALGKGLIKSVA